MKLEKKADFIKPEDGKTPIIYTTSTKGSLFRHGSVNPTLYFHIEPDPDAYAQDPLYHEYFDELYQNEFYMALVNKFIVSQPLIITNDKIPFVLFKSNIDPYSLYEFCKAIVQELDFHTGLKHQAQYGLCKSAFMEIGRNPGILASIRTSSAGNGEKLTRTPFFEQLKNPIAYDKDPMDQGIMTPYSAWLKEKQRQQAQAAVQEAEEIVTW